MIRLTKNIKTCDAPLVKKRAPALKFSAPTLFFINGTKVVGILRVKEIDQRFLDE